MKKGSGLGSVYQRASDGRWVAARSIGSRASRVRLVRYGATREEAIARLAAIGGRDEELTSSARFWSKVAKGRGCWEWQSFRIRPGSYGIFWDGTRRVVASRFAYEDVVGPIPDGQMVLHRCDNPPCVRPDHLFLGDAKDNATDMIAKGRAGFQRSVSVSGTTRDG